MSSKRRELAEVAPKLQTLFCELAAGRAAWPLYLFGDQGRGKTAAALALCDHVVRVARYFTCSELTDLVLAPMRGGAAFDWDAITSPICQLVVLDELGTRKVVSDTHYDAVQRVLDYRENRPLVLISNHPVETLAEIYDARIASRCGAGTVFELRGHDRRIA